MIGPVLKGWCPATLAILAFALIGRGGSTRSQAVPSATETAWAKVVNLREGDAPGLEPSKLFASKPVSFGPFGGTANRSSKTRR